ncbi:hypothetical protein OUZ56_026021 [Daphnia magna]|uniref:Uncharacterized protein n=1 Tax=Daphnia magna TaxID=35525 RepID=A0ABQ9ZLE0_9CRUS|nr:hypothetical protein OUZ56_026021 [Daphnia magna]
MAASRHISAQVSEREFFHRASLWHYGKKKVSGLTLPNPPYDDFAPKPPYLALKSPNEVCMKANQATLSFDLMLNFWLIFISAPDFVFESRAPYTSVMNK